MNFEPNDEQRQLEDSVQRLLRDKAGFEQRRAAAASPAGHDPALWRALAELGVTAIAVDAAHGGFGGGAVDRLAVLRACGRALVLEPVLASCVLGTTALVRGADAELRARLLPAVASGEAVLAWADDEGDASGRIETRAVETAEGWRLDGRKRNVLQAPLAHHLIVTARRHDGGLALFVVDRGADGMALRAHRLVDDTPAAEVTLNGGRATPLGDPFDAGRAEAVLRRVLDAGIAAACADMVGAMEGAFDLAIGYLNTRKQFGRLIGENQALRHKAAEMLVGLEMAKSMAIAAAIAADRPDDPDSAADLARAKLVVGRHARALCQTAIQLHGGIGMTEEYAVGHALRRVHVLDHLFGDVHAQADRLAEMAFSTV